jgi:Domain of unknown function (DUF4340)
MGFQRILIAAAVLAVLSGGVWWSNRQEAKTADKPDPNAAPAILKIPVDQIQKVEIASGDKDTTVQRADDGQYKITAPKEAEADQVTASGVFTLLSDFNSTRLIEEAGDAASYGLDDPSIVVTITKKDNGASKLLIGDETPTGGAYFAKLDGDPRIFTTSSVNKSGVDKGFDDLRDKRLLPFNRAGLKSIELTSKGSTYEFTKNDQGSWRISRPSEWRADESQMEQLITQVSDAQMNPEAPEVKPAVWSQAAVVGRIRMTDDSGTKEIQVRKGSDKKYYANSEVIEGAHSVNDALGEALEKGGAEYRNKKLFDFGYAGLSQVEIKDNGRSRVFSQGDDQKWTSGGKEMDSVGMQSLIDKLRDLTATGFPKSGFGQPSLEARVVVKTSQRAEHVLISRSGDRWIAQRENEPTLYELEAGKVKELQQAAADVKAAVPEKDATAKAK